MAQVTITIDVDDKIGDVSLTIDEGKATEITMKRTRKYGSHSSQ